MSARRSLPDALARRARAFAVAGQPAVPARLAATVVLLRDLPTGGGIEAYVLRRHVGMAFAGGMHAFPGGGVDPRDAHAQTAWAGPSPQQWARRLGVEPATARAAVCAAVRETFEESGVLLAGPVEGGEAGSVVADTSSDDWEEARRALVERRLALSDLLEQRSLQLRSDLLGAWTRWITPRFEERRFDTFFFVAALPAGQHSRDVSGEADLARWVRPEEAVRAADAGEMAMLPPTWQVLRDLADFSDVAAVLAAGADRRVETILPGWRDDGQRVSLVLPGDPGYPGDDPGGEAGGVR